MTSATLWHDRPCRVVDEYVPTLRSAAPAAELQFRRVREVCRSIRCCALSAGKRSAAHAPPAPTRQLFDPGSGRYSSSVSSSRHSRSTASALRLSSATTIGVRARCGPAMPIRGRPSRHRLRLHWKRRLDWPRRSSSSTSLRRLDQFGALLGCGVATSGKVEWIELGNGEHSRPVRRRVVP